MQWSIKYKNRRQKFTTRKNKKGHRPEVLMIDGVGAAISSEAFKGQWPLYVLIERFKVTANIHPI